MRRSEVQYREGGGDESLWKRFIGEVMRSEGLG